MFTVVVFSGRNNGQGGELRIRSFVALLIFASFRRVGSRYRTGQQAVDSDIQTLPCDGERGEYIVKIPPPPSPLPPNSKPAPLNRIEVAVSNEEIRWRKMLTAF